jgi:hypothetical protein
VDEGVDFSARPGQSIKAMGDARIIGISPNWYKGQPYLSYELTSGSQKGKIIYVAEQITPTVKAGQHVRAGDQIGVYAGSGTGIETGYGSRTPGLAASAGEYTEGKETGAGKAYRQLFEQIASTPHGSVHKTPGGPVYVPRR